MLLLERNDYLFSFDLKSGYHHVDVAEAHQRFLGIECGGAYYMFTVLPFGLSTACTKLLLGFVFVCHYFKVSFTEAFWQSATSLLVKVRMDQV